MNEAVEYEIVILPPELLDLRMKLLADEEGGDDDARAKKKGERVVVGEADGCEHLGEEGERGEGFVAVSVGADERVPEEGGGRMWEAAEEEEGVVDVDSDKGGDEFSDGEWIGDSAGDEEASVDLLEFAGRAAKAAGET